MAAKPAKVLVAGIGGASLGTEIIKCLKLAGRYAIYGCDISKFAYGHYQEGVAATFVVSRDRYVDSVLEISRLNHIEAILPGGEQPLTLLSGASEPFTKAGAIIATNSPEVVALCSDKKQLFDRLLQLRLPVPWTTAVEREVCLDTLQRAPYPCVIKPSKGSGGSRSVVLASTPAEAALYVGRLISNGEVALVQEYIPFEEGEFTIGVLSLPNGKVVGSIAMQRLFHSKLSVLFNTKDGLISSGYSQGLIDEFPGVREQAERIARLLGSVGPMNIQGRLRNGILIPFEINPRFSATTYLRALAGFNEIDMYLGYALYRENPVAPPIRSGYYLRSLSEIVVPKEKVKQ